MKGLLPLVTLSLTLFTRLYAQEYWQQEVNYKISVSLDDRNHILRGFESFEYINHSPQALDSILIHIWPNAYVDGKTALAEQLYSEGNQVLQFGADSLKGCIDSLDFRVGKQAVNWKIYADHRDICVIYLNERLLPEKSITISTPFRVQIPSGSISRLGHVGESYQITQWYPKPAVFDASGWHAIPYLNQGEFYSEYGSYDVSITLPENYVVGATGDLQTESEIAFMEQKFEETQLKFRTNDYSGTVKHSLPESSEKMKTIRFTQSRVHDFAWFADKRYQVLKGEVTLPNTGKKVTSWALFTPKNASLWEDAIEYINDGTYYYSLWNGDYPYNQVTAVDGTISAGGGMEYPNVTVIGNASSKRELEIVIVHEVGHNWFYGILGSNERLHGWMDEGMNTLNEIRYVQTKYPDNDYFSKMIFGGIFHFDHLSHKDMADFSYRAIASVGADQPIETHSADFTPINYGVIMYQKTGAVFLYLKDYLGDTLFDKCMHAYFEKWKFKHPQPEDMQRTLEEVSGKDLSWLFEDLIQTTNHIDYKISSVKLTKNQTLVIVKNVGQIDGPIPVSAMEGDSIVETLWLEPGNKKGTLVFMGTHHTFRIDPDHTIPELNRTNNNYDRAWFLNRVEPLQLNFLTGYNKPLQSNNYWLPVAGYNVYDKFMIGVALHNLSLVPNKFQYVIAPMYSFGRNNVSGIAELGYNFLPKKGIRSGRLGLSFKTFKEGITQQGRSNRNVYYAFSPYLHLKLGNRGPKSPFENSLLIQGLANFREWTNSQEQRFGGFVKYAFRYTRPDHQVLFSLRNDYVEQRWAFPVEFAYARISGEITYRYRYLKNRMKRWVELRLSHSMNYYINQPLLVSPFTIGLTGGHGYQDVFLEDYFFDRNSYKFSAQQTDNMGNFRTGVTRNFSRFVSTANLTAQLPVKPNIFLFFADFGTGQNKTPSETLQFFYNTGLGLHFGDFFAVYFPLYNSDNLNTGEKMFDNYQYKIRFTLKLNIVNKDLHFQRN